MGGVAAPADAPRQAESENYDFTEQVGYLLRRAYQRHLAIFQDNTAEQLTSVQFSTLCALKRLGPSSQAELVTATAVDQATIRGIIGRLKDRNLIMLRKDAVDARKVIVVISDLGLKVLDQMIPRALVISELTVAELNAAERVALTFILRKIIDGNAVK